MTLHVTFTGAVSLTCPLTKHELPSDSRHWQRLTFSSHNCRAKTTDEGAGKKGGAGLFKILINIFRLVPRICRSGPRIWWARSADFPCVWLSPLITKKVSHPDTATKLSPPNIPHFIRFFKNHESSNRLIRTSTEPHVLDSSHTPCIDLPSAKRRLKREYALFLDDGVNTQGVEPSRDVTSERDKSQVHALSVYGGKGSEWVQSLSKRTRAMREKDTAV